MSRTSHTNSASEPARDHRHAKGWLLLASKDDLGFYPGAAMIEGATCLAIRRQGGGIELRTIVHA